MTPPPPPAPWYRWPEDQRTGRVAWFVVLRRLAFAPVFAVGMTMAYVAVAGAYGSKEAARWLNDQK